LDYESEPLLALTAFVAHQSRGLPLQVEVRGRAQTFFEAGRKFYNERQGQLDLSCRQCHDDLVGRKLRGDTISSGIGTGYPAYRLEWQGLGSLHRRLQACQAGVRAAGLEPGSPDHLSLELYLAWRATGAAVETPAIRR
jgi:sulfur-oxidizing protein SoxA